MSSEQADELLTKTGGRPASGGVIPGRYSLSVGMPPTKPPEGWDWVPLSKIARLESGHTPSRKRPEYWGGDVPWIGIRDATGNHGTTIFDTQQHTNDLGIRNSSARVLPANTVCLSRTASVGYVVVMGRPMATSQDFVNWVCFDAIDYRFLKYILLSEHESMLRFASGTTHQTIYFPEAKAFHVCIPALESQKNIVAILQSLDDRIALLRETNATLEAIAQALFKSWFVDFDPVRAKMEGRVPDGMDEATAALFPDGLEETELGRRPKGWDVVSLATLMDIAGGMQPPADEFIGRMQDGYVRLIQIRDYETDSHLTYVPLTSKLRVTSREDVMIARYGASVGRICWGLEGAYNVALVRVVCDTHVREFLRTYLMSNVFQSRLDAVSGRSAQAGFNKSDIASFRLVSPTEQLLEIYHDAVWPMRETILHNRQQVTTLSTLRDTLLPRLISGQLRLPEAAVKIEAIAA